MNNPCVSGTPVERLDDWLWVKREDLCCPGGPDFSKMRGVYAHLARRPETVIGVLDTYHSQAGHAVARAGKLLNKTVFNFYPSYKRDTGPRDPQQRAYAEGAQLIPLKAGMSAVLWHQAKRTLPQEAYMMPNGLQLRESIRETSLEVQSTELEVWPDTVVVAASSGTIAQGVVEGFLDRPESLFNDTPHFIIHMGYSRSQSKLRARFPRAGIRLTLIDEGYAYKDKARGATAPPPFPCNQYYDLKAWEWLLGKGRMTLPRTLGNVLFWNIGA